MSLIDDLTKVKKRLRKNWVQGRLAESDSGAGVGPQDPTAARWCFVGAIQKEFGKSNEGKGYKVVTALSEQLKKDPAYVLYYNEDNCDDNGNAITEKVKFSNSGGRVSALIDFNDTLANDVEDVINLINRAIKRHRRKNAKPNVTDITVTTAGNLKISAKKGSVNVSFIINLKDYPAVKCTEWVGYKPQAITTNAKGIITVKTSAGSFVVDIKKHPEVIKKIAALADERLKAISDKLPTVSQVVLDRLVHNKAYVAPTKSKQTKVETVKVADKLKVPVLA